MCHDGVGRLPLKTKCTVSYVSRDKADILARVQTADLAEFNKELIDFYFRFLGLITKKRQKERKEVSEKHYYLQVSRSVGLC